MPAAEVGAWFRAHADTDWARREATIAIPADLDRIGEVRKLVERQAAVIGLSEADLWDVRTAATEGVANAIEHGVRGEDRMIHVRVAEVRGDLLVEIVGGGREPGATVEPRKHPGGRGITIMNQTMDLVRLTHGRDGNVIRMTKSLPPRSSIHTLLDEPVGR
jgi:anti-sigma regulatory factor (Ser/Thr protein kinase)